MNEELILRTMTQYNMSRDEAIALIMGNQSTLNPIESSATSLYTGLPNNTVTTPFQVNYTPQNIEVPTNYLNNNAIPSINSNSYPLTSQTPIGGLPTRPISIGDLSITEDIVTSNQPPVNNPSSEGLPLSARSINILSQNEDVNKTLSDGYAQNQAGQLNALEQASMYASMFNPYGSDLETELYSLGRGIGNAQNGQGGVGNTLGIIGAAGAALLGGTRSALSGYSNSIANNRYWQWMQNRRARQDNMYSPQAQTQNTQSTMLGGITAS